MGMGAYDEDEQEKRQPDFDEEDDSEVITLQEERQDGEVRSETPDDVSEMMENFKKNTADD